MKTFKLLTALGALALASTTASAEVICDNCPLIPAAAGTYLGQHWQYDKSTFNGRNGSPVALVDHAWVFDVNETSEVSISVDGPFRLSVQWDEYRAICDAVSCSDVYYGAPVFATKTRRLRTGLTPGRYVLRIQGPAGTHYNGTLALVRSRPTT